MSVYQNTGPSGGKLAFLLGCSVKMPHDNQNRYEKWSREEKRDGILPMAINYGCKKEKLPKSLNASNCLNFNSQDVGDKVKCFEIFDAFHIPHPQVITDPANYDGFFLGRKNNSSQGNGITKFKPRSENWNKRGSDFFVEYIEVAKEFRVHVFKGHVICEFNKDFTACKDFIHSKQFGSKLKFGPLDHPDRFGIIDASIKAIHGCGLDYGAVDIISDINDKWYILEVNSAPSMAHTIGFLYAERIAHFFNIELNKWWTINQDGTFTDNRKTLKDFTWKQKK